MLISFLFFFLLFTAVGLAAGAVRKGTLEDYFLASRNVPSWMIAMSYGATISSGATFIGFAGLAYHSGLSALVAVAALMIGDHIAWIMAQNKIRRTAVEKDIHTYPALVGNLGDQPFPLVTKFTALLTVFFLGAYCAAQIVAGAKIGVVLFDWDYTSFVVLGALVLVGYCWAGGIRASIWTDAVQALMIFASLLILIIAGLIEVGGFGPLIQSLNSIDPTLLDTLQLSYITVAVGWLFFGVAVLGQPQLMIRHMVARSDADLRRARWMYMLWRWSVLLLSVLSGMIARVLIPAGENFDPELSIPMLWQDLLPPVLVGFLVAGLFSATMSTADSLLLSASSALTQHVVPRLKDCYVKARMGTIAVILLVIAIALFASQGVLALVILAWAGLGAAVTPLVTVQLLGARPSYRTALSMMFAGFAVTMIWRYGLGWHVHLMDLVPGMITGFVVFAVLHGLDKYKLRNV